MNPTLKSILLGIVLGSAPTWICGTFYYIIPLIVPGNPGALLSFAVMGLFVMIFVAAFILSIVLISRNKPLIGKIGLFVLLGQIVAAYFILTSQ